jgi:hypothetical protein
LNNDETLARIEVILALSDKDLGQLRPFSNPATPTPLGFLPSFDHLIRSIQHRLWNRQADLLRRLEINHQLELCRLLHCLRALIGILLGSWPLFTSSALS